jgi:hypothetical protein
MSIRPPERDDGTTYRSVDHDHIARARLRVDSRKWILSKMLPRIYGDRPVVEDQIGVRAPASGEDGEDHLAAPHRRPQGQQRQRREAPLNKPLRLNRSAFTARSRQPAIVSKLLR